MNIHTVNSGQQCCGTRGAVGGSVPCSRVSPQSWYWRRPLSRHRTPNNCSPGAAALLPQLRVCVSKQYKHNRFRMGSQVCCLTSRFNGFLLSSKLSLNKLESAGQEAFLFCPYNLQIQAGIFIYLLFTGCFISSKLPQDLQHHGRFQK